VKPRNRNLGVLVSGRGSNLQAIVDAIADGRLDARIAVVLSNRPEAPALVRAAGAGIAAECIDHRAGSREAFETALVAALLRYDVGLVCMAGFMRVLGPTFLQAFPHHVLNVHPSLLPSFPGVDAQRQAFDHGVKVSGVTVHLVTGTLDGGPIVVQRAVPVLEDDTPQTLAARILVEEHRAYPEAIRLVLEEDWRIEGRRFLVTR
jgi:phosphoribosylglycinamide formyltransferase-1